MTDTKISDFTVAGALDRINDVVPIVQSGANKKIAVKDLIVGAIKITVGDTNGPPLVAGTVFQDLVGKHYSLLTGWRLWVSPSGSITLSIRKKAFASIPPTALDKISGTGGPTISSGTTATSDDLSAWSSTSFNRTDAIQVVIDSVSGNVSWFSLEILGG